MERDMDYGRRVAQVVLVLARGMPGMLDSRALSWALYWAFIAGQLAADGRDYTTAKREAAALDLVPPCLQDAEAEETN